MELEGDLHSYPWLGEGNNCNTYAIRYQVDEESRFAVIDPGHWVVPTPLMDPRTGRAVRIRQEPAFERLLLAMRQDGIAAEAVGLVVFTHGHIDHCEAGPLLKRKGARLALHQEDEGVYLEMVSPGYGDGSVDVDLDIHLREGELWLGKPPQVCLQVLLTPGHSPGSVSLYWVQRKALFTGDVVFYRNVGRTDIPGGNLSLLRESVRRLSELDAEYLLTGHPYGHPGVIQSREAVVDNFKFILQRILP